VVVVPVTILGIWRHRLIATPEAIAAAGEAKIGPAVIDAALLNEAKRDFG